MDSTFSHNFLNLVCVCVCIRASLVAQMVTKICLQCRRPGFDPLQKATHSSILAWKIPWTEEPGRLQSTGSQRVRHNWATNTHTHTHTLCSNKRFPEQRLISCSYLLNVGHGLVMAVLHVSSLWDPGHRVAPIWVTDVPIADRRQTIELSCYGSESFCLEMA